MSRVSRRSAALGLLASAALALSGCSSAALPELTDPSAIITAALKATETARSVHLDATVDGSINADLFGTGDTGSSFALTGTTASADIDIAGGNARATFAVPALLGLTGELIQIGETSYVKTSLSGPLFQTQEATDSLPIDPTDTTAMVDDIGDFLLKDGVDPVKGEDVQCGTVKCYTVTIELTAEELAALDPAGAATDDLPVDIGAASLTLTIRVEKDTYHLSGITAVASLGDQGSLTLDLNLSRWDEALAISAPPADQLAPAS
jgi:hypothetical protein